MALKDPEGFERKNLNQLVDLHGKRVLEIGSGEGRLTRQFAADPSLTVGVDPDRQALQVARADCPDDLRPHVHFSAASAAAIPFPKDSFDIVLLSWSLC